MNTIIVNRERNPFAKIIAPVITSVFAVYLTIGMSLGVLPGFIRNDLKWNALMVGLAIGIQSLATLLIRAYAGKLTDIKGAKITSHTGILLILLSGLLYSIAVSFNFNTTLALGLLLLARFIHGVSESLAITGALAWGIGLVGTEKSGKVMTWNGIAMYAGIAIGAPAAIWIKNSFGITDVFVVVTILSAISWLSTVKLPALPVQFIQVRTPFYRVIGLIASQGLGLAFSSIGFACISSFIALLFAAKNWGNPSMAFVAFGASYILIRIFFSSFPDRFGGYKVALVSLTIEISGQLLIGFASSKSLAITGCALTGVGFSLIFPALGVLAIKKVSPQMRGTALGGYSAFFDLSLSLAGPLAGIIVSWYSFQSVYIFGALSCLLSIGVLSINRRK
jgi:MFS family permease